MSKRKLKKQSYSTEFKKNAVKLTLKPEATIQQVADSLGIPANNISKWRKQFGVAKEFEAAEARIDAFEENKRLQKELRELKMELEILKKAAIYFASQK